MTIEIFRTQSSQIQKSLEINQKDVYCLQNFILCVKICQVDMEPTIKMRQTQEVVVFFWQAVSALCVWTSLLNYAIK